MMRTARGILMDFDGPICSLFAGYPARDIADQLRAVLEKGGVRPPAPLDTGPNPLKLLAWTGHNAPALLHIVEDSLIEAELRAAETARPTPYAHHALAIASRRHPIAIASNNSKGAIQRYLTLHDLAGFVTGIVGRAPGRPDLMKPNPAPLLQASLALELAPSSCALVGDSPSDMEAGRRAGIRCIGYAKSPERAESLEAAGAETIIHRMRDLATFLEINDSVAGF